MKFNKKHVASIALVCILAAATRIAAPSLFTVSVTQMLEFIFECFKRFHLVNGGYDLISGFLMIAVPRWNHIHVSMYNRKLTGLERRLLAYWIITYGAVRLMGSHDLVAGSYFLEAVAYALEWGEGRMHPAGSVYTTTVCSIFGFGCISNCSPITGVSILLVCLLVGMLSIQANLREARAYWKAKLEKWGKRKSIRRLGVPILTRGATLIDPAILLKTLDDDSALSRQTTAGSAESEFSVIETCALTRQSSADTEFSVIS